MSKIIAASTLALAISIGGAFWGNGAQASTSSAKLQTEQWMWSIAALADHDGSRDGADDQSEDGSASAEATE
ncbi:hypothetical protein SAMN05216312_116117 [Cohnella sp. OV330]|uniref:hypothetical protein n=1 Tax=Cohnella sp. OV330 TaxID=1855288 RepID=UPI0008E30C72|nr:hypothetical protein [Cohnella sp. OV330]SFB60317.1 hypothetical protein SAMN05216312_116117 [Cohnella sp. OV330]